MRRTRLLRFLFALLLAAVSTALPAQEPGSILAKYNNRGWRLVDGAPPDIWALAQSSDGFLWLGTGSGLYRFDGVTFEEFRPRSGNFPALNITSLLATPEGTLWIGYLSGEISRLRAGTLDSFGPPSGAVEQIARSPDGTIWAARTGANGGLFRFDGRDWRRVGRAQGIADRHASSVLAARDGAIWVATERSILVRHPGDSRFVPVLRTAGRTRLGQAPDGRVWASGNAAAIARPTGAAGNGDGRPRVSIVPLPPGARDAIADRMLFARDGSLWQSALTGDVNVVAGLSAVGAPPRFEWFTPAEGLTSRRAVPLLEDREGNIWIGTNLGLNRLRPVSAVAVFPGKPPPRQGSELAATADGVVYLTQGDALYRVRPEGFPEHVRRFAQPITLIEADRRDLIVGQPDVLYRLRDGVPRRETPQPPGALASWTSMTPDTAWATISERGVFRRAGGCWHRVAVAPGLNPALVHTPSGAGGGDWMFAGNRLFRRRGDGYVELRGDAAPRVGRIALLSSGPAGVFVGGERGIALLDGDRFRTIDSTGAPDIRGVTGILQAPGGVVWINGVRGLIRTDRDAIATALTRGTPLRHRLFNAGDGLPGVAQQDEHRSTVVRGGDGRIWVANNGGVGMIDPRRLVFNRLPPPVAILDLNANDRTIAEPRSVALPAGTQNLRIRYTALSLAAPQRVEFRYRLVGIDSDWVDAGTRREAFYANLPPGEWRFQVIAANNDGAWNAQGAAIDIAIAPYFYQRWWFRLLVLAAAGAMLWLAYIWRVRELSARASARVQARLNERERIARELHDTLLQGVQGLVLRFQAAANATKPGSKAHGLIERALERADDFVLQARDRVRALRSGGSATFAQHLERIAAQMREDGLPVSLAMTGPAPALGYDQIEPLVAIVEEALTNSLRHAHADRASIEVRCSSSTLAITISDDGDGFPEAVIGAGGRPGHFGLLGMRERAAMLSGTLELISPPGGGATVRVEIPMDAIA